MADRVDMTSSEESDVRWSDDGRPSDDEGVGAASRYLFIYIFIYIPMAWYPFLSSSTHDAECMDKVLVGLDLIKAVLCIGPVAPKVEQRSLHRCERLPRKTQKKCNKVVAKRQQRRRHAQECDCGT